MAVTTQCSHMIKTNFLEENSSPKLIQSHIKLLAIIQLFGVTFTTVKTMI